MTNDNKISFFNIHNFAAKLCQPSILPRLKEYVRWQADCRTHPDNASLKKSPPYAPVSINLDLTTACNFACPHCVDMPILNKGIRFDDENLKRSISLMAEKGLKSIIIIGGGEPTCHPRFEEFVRFVKSLKLQVSIVSNGTGNQKLLNIADCLESEDWIRLSLDAAEEETFRKMHLPKIKTSLQDIVSLVPEIKKKNPVFNFGFSFVITWKGATIHDNEVVENIHEIAKAANLAKKYKFDYIAFKPFLSRSEMHNAEVVGLEERFNEVVCILNEELNDAEKLVDDSFRVYRTTNLKLLLSSQKSINNTGQPQHCHMQFFRQILSPLGTFNCPSYRNQEHAKLGDKEAYLSSENFEEIRKKTSELISDFDAQDACKEVTCLYNHVNWWIEDLISHPEKLDEIPEWNKGEEDYFL